MGDTPTPPFVAVPIWDFDGRHEDELSFKAGQEVVVTSTPAEGWWQGHLKEASTTNCGWFPSNYCVLSGAAANSSASSDASRNKRKSTIFSVASLASNSSTTLSTPEPVSSSATTAPLTLTQALKALVALLRSLSEELVSNLHQFSSPIRAATFLTDLEKGPLVDPLREIVVFYQKLHKSLTQDSVLPQPVRVGRVFGSSAEELMAVSVRFAAKVPEICHLVDGFKDSNRQFAQMFESAALQHAFQRLLQLPSAKLSQLGDVLLDVKRLAAGDHQGNVQRAAGVCHRTANLIRQIVAQKASQRAFIQACTDNPQALAQPELQHICAVQVTVRGQHDMPLQAHVLFFVDAWSVVCSRDDDGVAVPTNLLYTAKTKDALSCAEPADNSRAVVVECCDDTRFLFSLPSASEALALCRAFDIHVVGRRNPLALSHHGLESPRRRRSTFSLSRLEPSRTPTKSVPEEQQFEVVSPQTTRRWPFGGRRTSAQVAQTSPSTTAAAVKTVLPDNGANPAWQIISNYSAARASLHA